MINVGLIAHDGKKPEMVSFVVANKAFLMKTKIYATGTTGGHIAKEGFDVECLLSGPKGGDAQIAACVMCIIFHWLPIRRQPIIFSKALKRRLSGKLKSENNLKGNSFG